MLLEPAPKEVEDDLLSAYRKLPAFPDAVPALDHLARAGVSCHAFSNGDPDDLRMTLDATGLTDPLESVVSVAPVRSFKPDPEVYAHFLARKGADRSRAWLISGNPFDVIGAARAGWNTVWLRRDPVRPFDKWEVEPTLTVPSLSDLTPNVA